METEGNVADFTLVLLPGPEYAVTDGNDCERATGLMFPNRYARDA